MKIAGGRVILALCLCFCAAPPLAASSPPQGLSAITLLDKHNAAIAQLIDGDQVQLRAVLSARAKWPTLVAFCLDGELLPGAGCTVQSGADSCQSDPLLSLGWYWSKDGNPRAMRKVGASANEVPLPVEAALAVGPRPTVMVHGF